MPLEKLRTLQNARLSNLVKRVYQTVPFYKKQFDDNGLHPDDIKTVEDLSKIPFTKKTDLRDNYPFNMFAKPMDEIRRIHASSGTTGKPTVVGYTNERATTSSKTSRSFWVYPTTVGLPVVPLEA